MRYIVCIPFLPSVYKKAGIYANSAETDYTEMCFEQLEAIEHIYRNMITATHSNFSKTIKKKNAIHL